MKKKARIRKRINVIFISLCVFVLLLTLTAFLALNQLKQTMHQIDNYYMPVVAEISGIQATFIDTQLLLHELVYSEDNNEKEQVAKQIEDSMARFGQHGETYGAVTAKYDPDLKPSDEVLSFNDYSAQYLGMVPAIMDAAMLSGDENQQKAISLLEQSDVPFNEAKKLLDGAVAGQIMVGGEFSDQAIDNSTSFNYILTIYGIICLTLSIFAALWVSKILRKSSVAIVDNVHTISGSMNELTKKSNQTMESSNELISLFKGAHGSFTHMVTSIQTSAGNAENTASSVEEISAAIEEMGRSIQGVASSAKNLNDSAEASSSAISEMAVSIDQVAKNALTIDNLTENVQHNATDGLQALERSMKGMEDIANVVEHASEVMIDLGHSSTEIGSIIEVIDDIADQTNLLALNAAIEAARAGEQGKGFAVVADEVRKLAERSAKATKEIDVLITGIQHKSSAAISAIESGTTKVKEGSELTRNANEVMLNIVQAITTISQEIKQISIATEEQAKGTDHIVQAVNEVARQSSQVTQATREQEMGSSEIIKGITHARDEVNSIMHATSEQSNLASHVAQSLGHIIEQAEEVNQFAREQIEESQHVSKSISIVQDNVDVLR